MMAKRKTASAYYADHYRAGLVLADAIDNLLRSRVVDLAYHDSKLRLVHRALERHTLLGNRFLKAIKSERAELDAGEAE
jgi:hypothetical protein